LGYGVTQSQHLMVRVGPLAKGRSRDGLQGTGLLFFFFFFVKAVWVQVRVWRLKQRGLRQIRGSLFFLISKTQIMDRNKTFLRNQMTTSFNPSLTATNFTNNHYQNDGQAQPLLITRIPHRALLWHDNKCLATLQPLEYQTLVADTNTTQLP
jgi:hypothetical protein